MDILQEINDKFRAVNFPDDETYRAQLKWLREKRDDLNGKLKIVDPGLIAEYKRAIENVEENICALDHKGKLTIGQGSIPKVGTDKKVKI